jgi:hypothetical protein
MLAQQQEGDNHADGEEDGHRDASGHLYSSEREECLRNDAGQAG